MSSADFIGYNAHGNGRSTRSDCLGKNGEAMPKLARSVERPSEPKANELTYLLAFSPEASQKPFELFMPLIEASIQPLLCKGVLIIEKTD